MTHQKKVRQSPTTKQSATDHQNEVQKEKKSLTKNWTDDGGGLYGVCTKVASTRDQEYCTNDK